jgi:hypothetical protein
MVILTPEFVTSHPAELVHNRNVKRRPDPNIVPFQAVIEFKFDYNGWSKGRAKGAINTLWKLRLGNESPLRYFVVLMRYSSPSITRWKNYWPMVKAEAERFNEIGSIFAINWLTIKTGHDEYRFGNWEHEDHI